jgi:hypothetical protein
VTDALLPLRDVTSRLRVIGEHYVGLQEIPVERIVGSVNRSVDFDRFFRTSKRHLRKRLDALRDAFGDRPMPPITVYEAGGLYFVNDGQHRVALTRQEGGAHIDAEVTAIQTSHALHPGVDILELVHTEQHRRLNERTRLDEIAPAGVIEFSRPNYYGELLALIQAHAYELGEARDEFVSLPEATRDWYAASWLPAIEAIEATGLKRAYDFKTYGDLYLWTTGKLRELRTTSRGRHLDGCRRPPRPHPGRSDPSPEHCGCSPQATARIGEPGLRRRRPSGTYRGEPSEAEIVVRS